MSEGDKNEGQTSQPAPASGMAATLRKPAVMWSLIGVVVLIAAAGGYFFFVKGKGGSLVSAESQRSICEATLDRARDYGVIPFASTLANPDPDKSEVDSRATCHAQAGTSQYAMVVDIHCDDMGKDTCLQLYSVQQDDGTSLFQRR